MSRLCLKPAPFPLQQSEPKSAAPGFDGQHFAPSPWTEAVWHCRPLVFLIASLQRKDVAALLQRLFREGETLVQKGNVSGQLDALKEKVQPCSVFALGQHCSNACLQVGVMARLVFQ